MDRLLLSNPYSFLGGGAGEPFFGLQRTVPPQILSFRFFTAPVLCASLGLHLPSSAAGGGRFRPPSEKADWKEEGEKKAACFSDGNGTEAQAGFLFWGEGAPIYRALAEQGAGSFGVLFHLIPNRLQGGHFPGGAQKDVQIKLYMLTVEIPLEIQNEGFDGGPLLPG